MSLTVIETGEVIEPMNRVEAERITARIADKLDAIADNLEQVLPLIGEALTKDAWKALGYASPTAYVSERFAGALGRLSADVRRPVVQQLSQAGMSTRAIAPVVGASHMTVSNDLAGVKDFTPAPNPAPRVQSATSAPSPAPAPTVTGMDGKTYSRPEPKPEPAQDQVAPKPRRKPLGDTVHRIAADVDLSLTALYDAADDRASTVKDDVRTILHRWHRHMGDIEAAYGLDGQNETPAETGEGSQ